MLQTWLQGPFIILIPFIYLMFTWELFCEDLELQLNLSTMATLGTEENGHCKEVAIIERWKEE